MGPEKYKEFEIIYNPKPIPCSDHDFDCVHPDYDGADGGNGMYLTASSLETARQEIDEYWHDQADTLLDSEICLTCKHWADEKERALQVVAYKAHHKCMDKKTGWPVAAGCNFVLSNGIDIYINGNATADLEFDANFGCNNWEKVTECE